MPSPSWQRVFEAGRPVHVMRSSGTMDEGWTIVDVLESGHVRVGAGGLLKDYPAVLLLEHNPQLLPMGLAVSVRREGGSLQDGWVVVCPNSAGVRLYGHGMLMTVSLAELLRDNVELLPPHPAGEGLERLAGGALPHGVSLATEQDVENLLLEGRLPECGRALRLPDTQELTPAFLRSRSLEPRYSFTGGRVRIHVSQPYESQAVEGAVAFVAWVEYADEAVHVRTFYRDRARISWHVASHCGYRGWIGKGRGSVETTRLPSCLQKILSRLAAMPRVSLSCADARTAFYGPLPYLELPESFAAEVGVETFGSFAEWTAEGRRGLPESFRYDEEGHRPDFDDVEDSYVFEHPARGRLRATVVASDDGTVRYMFVHDEQGRAWLEMVEDAQAPLNTYGVRRRVLVAGDLTSPAVDYWPLVPDAYVGQREPGAYLYVDASAYTHLLAPVRAFLEEVGIDEAEVASGGKEAA